MMRMRDEDKWEKPDYEEDFNFKLCDKCDDIATYSVNYTKYCQACVMRELGITKTPYDAHIYFKDDEYLGDDHEDSEVEIINSYATYAGLVEFEYNDYGWEEEEE